ncbi:MAG: hypothetical protein ABJA67_10050 [Chthonomonadales bacterium]
MKTRFEDGSCRYPQSNPFELLDDRMLAKLGMDNPKRRIVMKPVITKDANASIAFFGLSAYCGEDYEEACVQPNFSEWCQDRYNSKLKVVIDRHTVNPQFSGSAYYSNYFKVVLPEHMFKSAADVKPLMSDRSIINAMDTLCRKEIEQLINSGCTVFVAFGEDAYNNIVRCLNLDRMHSIGTSGRLVRGNFNGKSIYLVRERHFAYYSNKVTDGLDKELRELT